MSYNYYPPFNRYPMLRPQWDPIAKQVRTTYEGYEKIISFKDVGFFLEPYVAEGGAVTLNAIHNNVIDVTTTVVSLDNNVMSREGVSFQVEIPSTAYILAFTKEGDFYWGVPVPPGASGVDFLYLASVTVSASGSVTGITDLRGDVGGFRLKSEFGLEGYLRRDGTSPMLADLNMNAHKIIGVSTPTAATDAATKGYADTKVSKSGDTMTDTLIINLGTIENTTGAAETGMTASVTTPDLGHTVSSEIVNIRNGNAGSLSWEGVDVRLRRRVDATGQQHIDFTGAGNITIRPLPTGLVQIDTGSGVAEVWHDLNNAANLAQNGFQRLASGVIFQWGTFILTASQTTDITFPMAFGAGVTPQVVGTSIAAPNDVTILDTVTNTKFTAQNLSTNTRRMRWIAIGWL